MITYFCIDYDYYYHYHGRDNNNSNHNSKETCVATSPFTAVNYSPQATPTAPLPKPKTAWKSEQRGKANGRPFLPNVICNNLPSSYSSSDQ